MLKNIFSFFIYIIYKYVYYFSNTVHIYVIILYFLLKAVDDRVNDLTTREVLASQETAS